MGLINKAREEFGVPPVALGINGAAQQHADEMLLKGYKSHWGTDGQKPYMRYTREGGYNYEAENIYALPYPIDLAQAPRRDVFEMLDEAHASLMNSDGFKSNILNKWHKTVSIGVSYSSAAVALVQQFEGDYIAFSRLPSLDGGSLSFTGESSDGFLLDSIQVWYDPLPEILTRGQLGKSTCYDIGSLVALVRPPDSYSTNVAQVEWSRCPDPHSYFPNTLPPGPSSDSAAAEEQETTIEEGVVPLVSAVTWNTVQNTFDIRATLRSILSERGAGVYTIVLWGKKNGDLLNLTNYSIWYRNNGS